MARTQAAYPQATGQRRARIRTRRPTASRPAGRRPPSRARPTQPRDVPTLCRRVGRWGRWSTGSPGMRIAAMNATRSSPHWMRSALTPGRAPPRKPRPRTERRTAWSRQTPSVAPRAGERQSPGAIAALLSRLETALTTLASATDEVRVEALWLLRGAEPAPIPPGPSRRGRHCGRGLLHARRPALRERRRRARRCETTASR
jgi:hypothetical protein